MDDIVLDRNITKCMIKRSRMILSIFVNWSFIKFLFVGVPLVLIAFIPVIIINASIARFVLDTFNIPFGDPIRLFTAIILMFGSLAEMFIIFACISCIKFVENCADKIFNWIDLDSMRV